jgi:hypothetical protein
MEITVTLPIEEFNRLKAIEQESREAYIQCKLALETLRIRDEGRDETAFLVEKGYKLIIINNEYKLIKRNI